MRQATRSCVRSLGASVWLSHRSPTATSGRTGADTFLVLAAEAAADSARRLAERIVAEIEGPLRIGEAPIDVRARAAVLMATESTALPGIFGSVDAIDITVDALKAMPRRGRPQVIIL